jgi:tRNA pseudouridine38-40 synthase
MRYFIELAYNGTNYHGWQSQPNAVSVQETLEKALTLLLKTPIEIVGAGRTDAGVHAKQMYAHFDYPEELDAPFWVTKLNSYLPKSIVIYNIHPVSDDAHARFDATSRTYEYHLHTFKDAFINEGSWLYCQPLQLDLMNEATALLLHHTDFECFSKAHTDVFTFNCTITKAFWQQNGNQIVFTITADRFLRNMVRAIVGTFINIGLQKITIVDLQRILDSKDRSQAGFSVPAHGLYLTQITYPYLNA